MFSASALSISELATARSERARPVTSSNSRLRAVKNSSNSRLRATKRSSNSLLHLLRVWLAASKMEVACFVCSSISKAS